MRDAIQLVAAAVVAIATVWAGIRWLLGPAVKKEIRSAFDDEITRLAVLERHRDEDRSTLNRQTTDIGLLVRRVEIMETKLNGVDRLEAILDRVDERQEKVSETLSELTSQVGEVRGQLQAMRDRDRRHT